MPYIDGLPVAATINRSDLIAIDQGGTGTPGSATTRQVPLGTLFGSAFPESAANLYLNVAAFGAVLDGVTDDTAAWQAAVARAVVLGGGVITAPAGSTTVISGTITINASNIQFYLPDITVKLTGSASFNAFYFTGGYHGAPTWGGVNAAQFGLTVTLATLGGLTPGGWLMMQRDAPYHGSNWPAQSQAQFYYAPDVYTYIGKVRTITGTGPYVCTLVDPLPCSFGPSGTFPAGTYQDWVTSGAPFRINCMAPLDNVGISGNVTFDGSAATGTTVIGVYANACINSRFSGISGRNMTAGALVYAASGFNNSFSDFFGENCGTPGYDTFGFISQNQSQMHRMRITNAAGFGFGLESSNYCTVSDIISSGMDGRGVKIGACLHNTLSNITGHASLSHNGIAIAIASCFNTYYGCHGYSNEHFEGIWLSDQNNCDNMFFGCVAFGNSYDIVGAGNRDLHVGATDLRNVFFGAKIGTLEVHNDTTMWFGLNGDLLSGTNAATDVNAVTTLLDVTNVGTALITPGGVGDGTERWIGASNSGTSMTLNAPNSVEIQSANARSLLISGTSIQSSRHVQPATDGGSNLGAPAARWNMLYANGIMGLSLGNYANDGAAATGGVAIGQLYQTSGTVKVRVT